ncbi:MAG TPA: peptidoglycan-binding protein [Chthoniobacterales bacterium]|nr:peptidoglycan-binding protein [Chthoniobacterales bacterium]
MKKFTSLLIVCSLALAGAAFAQQPEEQPSPKNEKPAAEKTQPAEPKTPKTHAAETKSGANLASPEATAPTQHGAKSERPAKVPKTDTATQTGASGQPTASATPGGKQAGQGRKGMKTTGANAKTSPSATPATAAATASATAAPSASASATAATAASASAAPSVSAAGQQTTGGNAAVKADPQKVQQVKQQVQQIKSQHANFRAQPRPDKVPGVTFSMGYRIQGSDRWQGPQYEVYRSYHPERHDRGWYSSRYQRVELVGGGYYYWNNGYWYPAWGYDSSAEYYAYDAPIYVGHRAEPPDRVIADVQAELQQMGYYRGEVDGLLGPLTREALTAYQTDQGLMATAVIDQPTLDSLGMG